MTTWKQLTIYLSESDHWQHQPLYTALIEIAKQHGIAGATATRAIAGYGKHSKIHTTQLWDLASDLPIVVTIIDQEEVITEFIPIVQAMVKDGLITLHGLEILH
jgi:PII-like signaling protein